MSDKCSYPEGTTIKPDGIHELDPCTYFVTEVHRNVDVYVLKCVNCGHEEIEWERTPDTEDEYYTYE